MICYKDRTWCSFWKDCKVAQKYCDRALYPSVEKKAEEWSATLGQTRLISEYSSPPDCYQKSEILLDNSVINDKFGI